MRQTMLVKGLAGAASLAALLAVAPANAVPCGTYATVGGITVGGTDLGASSSTCQDGGLGDANESVGDLNDGAYFGSSDWTLLDKADNEAGDGDFWTFDPSVPSGQTSGTFSLAAGIWDIYSKLVVVLKDGGSTTNSEIKWSAYLLPNGVYGIYNWSYDNRKELSHITLYGTNGGTTKVPEPTALVLLGIGLAGAAVALRRQRARQTA